MRQFHASKAMLIPIEFLHVQERYITKTSKVDDEILQNSVRLTGVQQPLIVIPVDDNSFYVVDGVRRLNVAKSLDLSEVPCVVDHGIEDVKDRDEYRNRIRFILDEHRQDLLPTQRAKLIRQLQKMFSMTTRQVGLYLGVTSATITNWTHIEKVIPEVQDAIDEGLLTSHSARSFVSLSEKGQRLIWDEHRGKAVETSASKFHKWIRKEFPPTEFSDLYDSPELVIRQLKRQEAGRKGRKRVVISRNEKASQLKEFEAKKIEIEDKKLQIQAFEDDINAAIPIIEALLEGEGLWDSLPKKVRSDFEEFADRYIA
jgi:ParB/RepB/Spo0J family partition protein